MNFDWTEKEKENKKAISELFDEAALKSLAEMDEMDLYEIRALIKENLGRLEKTGYLKLAVGPERRSESVALMAAQEVLSGASSSLFMAVESSVRLFGGLAAGWGNPYAVKAILEPVLDGKLIGAAAFSEAGGAEPSEGMKTTAEKKGDSYVLSGFKNYATNGPIADFFAVAGLLEKKPAVFLVKTDWEGVSLGPRLKTMGYRGLAACSLELRDVVVPRDFVLGPFENTQAWDFAVNVQDIALTVASLGIMSCALNTANAHARNYHRGKKPIYAHQEIRFKISEMFTLYETAKLVTYRAGWFFATSDKESDVMIRCAKVFAAEATEQVAGMAMQIMAGQGYVCPNPVEQGYRDAKYAAIAGTSSEISRMKIADALLERYAV
jgi:alkylation response protein AidB-like acyl-CoA dehydrogenase